MHASQAEKNVFGHDVKIHPITKMPIENGLGALPEHEQALNHLRSIEAERGEQVEMRKQLGVKTSADIEAEAQAARIAEQAKADELADLKARNAALEAENADLKTPKTPSISQE